MANSWITIIEKKISEKDEKIKELKSTNQYGFIQHDQYRFFYEWFQNWKSIILTSAKNILKQMEENYNEDNRYMKIQSINLISPDSCSIVFMKDLIPILDEVIENAKNLVDEYRFYLKHTHQTKITENSNSNTSYKQGNLVFVIMAFKPDMKPIYEAIKESCKKHGLDAVRVDEIKGDYQITDKILESIRNARFIIADLTHERPNVYFELGYARGIGKKIITTVKEGTTVHFDVQGWRYLKYHDSRILEEKLQNEIPALIKGE